MSTPKSTPSFDDVILPASKLTIGSPAVDRFLGAVRRHLGMDIAFVSEFRVRDRVMRHVDAKSHQPIQVGDAIPLEDGYCRHVVEGTLPELIPDTGDVPLALTIPATMAIPIGAHLSVPIRLADGSCYGTFCCFSFHADHSLGRRDLEMMRVFADMLAGQIDQDAEWSKAREERLVRIRTVLTDAPPTVVYQPIYGLKDSRIAAFECLSRFHVEPRRPPNEWFREADEVGLGTDLEIAAIRAALLGLPSLPQPIYLTVNCSPNTVASGALYEALRNEQLARIVVEITEHVYIDDYTDVLAQLALLRSLGLRVAIDDAGAGYASMRHILMIRPDFIKLDISLTQHIDTDPMKRALAAALIAFAGETNAKIVAEGVETEDELIALRGLGVSKAQGYYLGRPMPLQDAVSLLSEPPVEIARQANDVVFKRSTGQVR